MVGRRTQAFIFDDLLNALINDTVMRDPLDAIPDQVVRRHRLDRDLATVRQNQLALGKTETLSDSPEILFLFGRLLVDPAVDVHDVLSRFLEQ